MYPGVYIFGNFLSPHSKLYDEAGVDFQRKLAADVPETYHEAVFPRPRDGFGDIVRSPRTPRVKTRRLAPYGRFSSRSTWP